MDHTRDRVKCRRTVEQQCDLVKSHLESQHTTLAAPYRVLTSETNNSDHHAAHNVVLHIIGGCRLAGIERLVNFQLDDQNLFLHKHIPVSTKNTHSAV